MQPSENDGTAKKPRERSQAAVHETVDRAADAESGVRAGVGVVVELRRRARRIGPDVHSGTPHPANAIAAVAGDRARRDLRLGVPVDEDAVTAVVLDSVRKSGRRTPDTPEPPPPIVLNRIGGAHPVVGRTDHPMRAVECRLDRDPARPLFWIVLLTMSADRRERP